MKALRCVTLVSALLSMPVLAHHGFGRFDMNATVEVSGTITGIEFVNPHSYVQFDMTLPDGSIRHMGCEMRAATVLRRSGWSREMFVAGKHIEITGRPHRDDPTSCYVETIAIGDAPVLERYQQLDDSDSKAGENRPMRLSSGEPNISGDWAQEQYLELLENGRPVGLVPKSMLAGIESGELERSAAPNSGWGPRPVTLTDAGKAQADIYTSEPPELHPRILCEITNILFDWVFDGPINRITQKGDTITLEYGRNLVRTVHMNMDGHPGSITPSRGGHSIGHWDGDTLVVDTVGFLPGRMAANTPHSDQLHVVERFTLERDWLNRLSLRRDYVADDSRFFADQYTGTDFVLLGDAPFEIDECKELAFEFTTGAESNP
jgi:hypothetical protein